MNAAEHHAIVAADFSRRVDGVQDWDAPAPVDGWAARDVVDHLVGWLPGFLAGGGVVLESGGPPVADDPAGAWHAHVDAVQVLIEGPDAEREFTHPQAGSHRLATAIDTFYTTDVFMHTWDLARASGQDDTSTPSSPRRCWPGWSRSTRCCASPASTVRGCRCRTTRRSRTG